MLSDRSMPRPAARLSRRRRLLPLLSGFIALLCFSGIVEAQEKRHLRHILLRDEKAADAILKALEGGADFKELARRYSLDTGNRILGGDLGWAAPAEYDQDFARVAFHMVEKGSYAKAKSRFGWHVIQYVDSKPAPGVAPPPPKDPQAGTPAPGTDRPANPPPTMADRNSDIVVTMDWDRVAFSSGERVLFSIEMKNTTDRPLDVWNPKLWPLGLLVKYQFNTNSPQFALPEGWAENGPDGGWKRMLGPGETLREQFDLGQYFGELPDWPILRIIWRGNVLFQRLSTDFPTLAEDREWANRQNRWRFYISEEAQVSILPTYRSSERWFVCLYSQGKTWIEIHDPAVPNLVEEFLDDLRHGVYTDQLFSQFVAGDHFAIVPQETDDPIGFVQPQKGIAWREGVVGLALTWEGRTPYIGSALAVALENPRELSRRAVPIGRVVLEEGNSLERIGKNLAESRLTKVSLALAYPASLAPPGVVAAADALPSPGLLARKIDPTPGKEMRPQLGGMDDRRPVSEKVPSKVDRRGEPGPVAKDSPRVEIETTAGKIVVQLYEDDAPNTVASFIALAESNFYDGTHVVRKVSNENSRGFVQLGSPDGTDAGHPGFTIADEVHARRHLTGVLSMARRHTVPDSAGCQFIICLDGLPYLDDSYTTFGQILTGLEVVDQLEQGDKIIGMKVLMKRPHEYKPVRTPVAAN